MACDEIRERFSEFIDGYLSRPEAAKVRGHLLACASCRQELKALVHTVKALRSLPERPAPAGFALRLEARIAEERASGWRRWVAWLDRSLAALPLKPMTAVAAAVFVLVFLLSTGNQLPNTNNLKLANNVNEQIVGVQPAGTVPVPVEFAATRPGGVVSGISLDTPIDFITAIIKNDPALRGFRVLPHPRGNGVLLQTPDYLYEITIDSAEFPIIQAYVEQHGGELPQSLKQARAMYPIYVRALPSPTKPLEQPQTEAQPQTQPQ